jgi:hypothetical protein
MPSNYSKKIGAGLYDKWGIQMYVILLAFWNVAFA